MGYVFLQNCINRLTIRGAVT